MLKESISPYRVFFPIASLWAIAGVGAWLWYLSGNGTYPAAFHSSAMIGGFVVSLAVGFLLTAVPKFTGASACTNLELVLAVLLCSGQLFCQKALPGLFAFLIFFFARRFSERKYSPPTPFLFVPAGLFLGFVGSLGIALSSAGVWEGSAGPFRAFLYQGTLLSLITGIGARLVRVLLGYEPSPLVQIQNLKSKEPVWFHTESRSSVVLHVILLIIGFAFEFFPGKEGIGRLLRAWVIGWVAFSAWKIHKFPHRRGALSWGLWFSCWSLFLGSAFYPFAYDYGVHVLHLIFIGGFGVMGLMVASRVVLAHGGFSVEEEMTSKTLRFVWILAVFAALARFGAVFTGAGYFRHLFYAALLFFVSVSTWTYWMLIRVFPHLSVFKPQQHSLKGEC